MRDESGGVTPSDAPGEVTRVVFAGGSSAHEWEAGALGAALAAPEGGAHQPAVEYIRGSDWGGGIGGILYTLRGGLPGYSHYNSRGDVVAKTDAAGSLTYRASYEAFGTRTQEQGATEDRQRANTKDEDPTGLLNEGFRYRDLVEGVWLTRDPAGFVDGPNLYCYVRQNPWSKFDSLGLAQNDPKGVVREDHHVVPVAVMKEHGFYEKLVQELEKKKCWNAPFISLKFYELYI